MFERFDDSMRRVLVLAQQEAAGLEHHFLGTEHLLLGLLAEGEGIAATVLRSFALSLEGTRAQVRDMVGTPPAAAEGAPPFTPRAKRVLELSLREALQLGHAYIGTEHLLLGLVREGEGIAAHLLIRAAGSLSAVRTSVERLMAANLFDTSFGSYDGTVGDLRPIDAQVSGATLLTPEDVKELLLGDVVAKVATGRTQIDGFEFETCHYDLSAPPGITLSVAAPLVTRAAFDASSGPLAEAQRVEGLGDAATYRASRQTLRVLSGTTLFVVQVRNHPSPRTAAIAVATKVLANLAA